MLTSDPVRDAEMASDDTRPVIGHCEECEQEIYGGDALYEGDVYYEIEGAKIHEDCIQTYLDRWYRHQA